MNMRVNVMGIVLCLIVVLLGQQRTTANNSKYYFKWILIDSHDNKKLLFVPLFSFGHPAPHFMCYDKCARNNSYKCILPFMFVFYLRVEAPCGRIPPHGKRFICMKFRLAFAATKGGRHTEMWQTNDETTNLEISDRWNGGFLDVS